MSLFISNSKMLMFLSHTGPRMPLDVHMYSSLKDV